MKNLKTLTGIASTAVLGFTSCQGEVAHLQGINTNTNSTNSTTIKI